ncbi:MAG: heavy metal-responsive transcriptional regulator [Anaerolineaceae bacterium]|nr:MAG: heavy metal-responsive transcriptional regulator [Anaerolineaceae bacterium]
MRIKQFSELTGLPPKTIRYYEEIGLLPPARRLDNGYRDYAAVDIDRGHFIAGARSLDFSLDDIQEILAMREQREAPCRVVLDLLQERADEINRRIAQLQRMETELRELHRLGLTFPTDDVDGKNCICHLVSEHPKTIAD